MRDVADDQGLDWEYHGTGSILARPRRVDAARMVTIFGLSPCICHPEPALEGACRRRLAGALALR